MKVVILGAGSTIGTFGTSLGVQGFVSRLRDVCGEGWENNPQLAPLKTVLLGLRRGDALVSFNWDTLAERILSGFGDVEVVGAGRPPLDPERVNVIKPHGSLSWLDLGESNGARWREDGSRAPRVQPMRQSRPVSPKHARRRYSCAPMLDPVLLLAAAVMDALRPRWALLGEIALLRHQLTALQRSVARPRVTRLDRIALVALAAITPTWRNVLRIVQPETLLRWHRAGFKALWRWRSRTRPASRLAPETAAMVRSMASANRLWGAERIRGELLKLGIRVSKRTVQKYMRAVRKGTPGGQRWSTFLRNHARETWACDFLQAYDVFFRPIFAFVFIELASRRVTLAATTRFPSHAWVTQQLRNATPFGAAPRILIRDRDDKFGARFDALARATGIRMVRTAVRAPNMNAVCERFLGSLRRECLDHILLLDDRHFHRVVTEYVRYHNDARPHQGIGQRTPVHAEPPAEGKINTLPVLAGLHHEYRRAA